GGWRDRRKPFPVAGRRPGTAFRAGASSGPSVRRPMVRRGGRPFLAGFPPRTLRRGRHGDSLSPSGAPVRFPNGWMFPMLAPISRRGLFTGTAALLASTALPRMAFAAGGRLTVAADSEPRQLNPAIAASNGVFFISSKVIEPLAEQGYDGLIPLLATSWEG